MPELDRFDARLEAAVHVFADRAQTSVDAVATAGRAIGHRRTGPWAVLRRIVPVPVSLLVAGALLVAFAGWSLMGGGSARPGVPFAPTPSPMQSGEPGAAAFVTGTGSLAVQSIGTTTLAASDIAHTRGVVIVAVFATDDPRVTGTGTYQLGVDASGSLGFASGALQLVTAGGAWEGTCTGSTRDGLTAGDLSCWLEGSGPYVGLTYYLNQRFDRGSEPDAIQGVILAATPPAP